ncbi:hypothetical protein GCM10023335_39320 [Streptomyces siamensis]|uniref:Uncharacterized protein n=1 Tax=Streptomyces siamensis TaxID=1274986 RepID=A0ABP9J0D9_9ACTN
MPIVAKDAASVSEAMTATGPSVFLLVLPKFRISDSVLISDSFVESAGLRRTQAAAIPSRMFDCAVLWLRAPAAEGRTRPLIHACGVGRASRWTAPIVIGDPVDSGFLRQIPCVPSTSSGVAFAIRA